MLTDEELEAIAQRAHNHRWQAETAKRSCENDLCVLIAEIHRLKDQLKQAHQDTLNARCAALIRCGNVTPPTARE